MQNKIAVETPSPRRTRALPPEKRAFRWAKDGRSREARLYRAVTSRLEKHLGGRPNHAQEMLISRIAWLAVHMARIDERAMLEGGLSPHSTREYLAWSNSLAKLLGRLGLESSAASNGVPSVPNYLDHLVSNR